MASYYPQNPQYSTNPQNETEAKAKAQARAIAYNKNWNVLYYPYVDASVGSNHLNQMSSGDPQPEDLESILKHTDDDASTSAAAAAAGTANIYNKNINIVVYK